MSACYPIQLSKSRHPPKGPRFSPNPLVRVKRNVSRRLPRLNPIPSDPDTSAVDVAFGLKRSNNRRSRGFYVLPRLAVNFAPGTGTTGPHPRLFPALLKKIVTAPDISSNELPPSRIPRSMHKLLCTLALRPVFRDQIPCRDAGQRDPPEAYSTTFGETRPPARGRRKPPAQATTSTTPAGSRQSPSTRLNRRKSP